MIKKTVTYTDYNGNQRTEDHYFHLNQTELTEMELSRDGGLSNYYQRIVAAQNIPELAAIFKELLLKSYGVKSDDGRGFIKVDPNGVPLSRAFSQTAAYDEIYMELITDTDKATAFFNGIVPENMKDKLKAASAEV